MLRTWSGSPTSLGLPLREEWWQFLRAVIIMIMLFMFKYVGENEAAASGMCNICSNTWRRVVDLLKAALVVIN